jgi:integrase
MGGKWRAQVRRRGHPTFTRTFDKRGQAERWARQVEADIEAGRAPTPIAVMGRALLLADVIDAYRRLREAARPISDASNEHYMLRKLARELGTRDALKLTPQDLVGYARARAEDGAGPYTVNMEVSKLGTVMRYASIALKVQLPDVVGQARPLLNHLGLIGGGGKRERRPTEDELLRLVETIERDRGMKFADALRFAVATTMRRGEVVRVRWDDVDAVKRLVLIRDRKDPRRKTGNDQWVPLLGDAWKVLQRQPRVAGEARIVPMDGSTLSKYFKSACRKLSIPDLRLHDMRHEGTSRLFEQGYEVQQVALVTGHKDWRHLRRYTQLRPEDLHRE